MTRKDFIHHAIISMCANPKCYDTHNNVQNGEEMFDQADYLADVLIENGCEFDDCTDEGKESTKTYIKNISESLFDICEALTDKGKIDLNPIQLIAESLYKMQGDTEDIANNIEKLSSNED